MTDILEEYDLGETIPIRHEPGDYPNRELVNRAVETVSDADGDLVISMKNVGATPWFRPTPYPNNEGVMVRMWSCISVLPKAVPGKTLLFGHRTPIWPDESENYNVRIFTREWMKSELAKGTHFKIQRAEDSPFQTDWYDWNWENRGGYPRKNGENE